MTAVHSKEHLNKTHRFGLMERGQGGAFVAVHTKEHPINTPGFGLGGGASVDIQSEAPAEEAEMLGFPFI